MHHRAKTIGLISLGLAGIIAGVTYRRGESYSTPVPIGKEPTREPDGFLDPENLDSLWALLSPERREKVDGALSAVRKRLEGDAKRTKEDIEAELRETRRFLIQFNAMQDRFSGDARETEPFVQWIEKAVAVPHAADARTEDGRVEGWAQSSMYVLAKAEAAVGLAAPQRDRVLKQIAQRWVNHYDEDMKAWCAVFLTAVQDRQGPLPPDAQAALDTLSQNEYVRSVLAQQAAELERSRKKAESIRGGGGIK